MIDNNTKIGLKKQIKKYLSELMDVNTEDIMDDVDLIEMGATSMVIIQLYVILQEEYGISLDATVDLYKSISLNEIVENIEKTKIDLEDIVGEKMYTKNIIGIKDARENQIDIVGGKGANLGLMISCGIPVPDGFIVTANA